MNTIYVLIIFMMAASSGCTKRPEVESPSNVTPSVGLPKFTIDLKISKEAESYLSEHKEGVVLRARFATEIGPSGLTLGNKSYDLRKSGRLEINNIPFDETLFRLLRGEEYEAHVGAYSAKITNDNNVLSCNYIQDKITAIQGKTREIACVLLDSAKIPRIKDEEEITYSGQITIKEFRARCPAPKPDGRIDYENNIDEEFCKSFVNGIINSHEVYVRSEYFPSERLFCIPRETPELEYVGVASQAVQNTMAIRGIAYAIVQGLGTKYHCQESK